MMDGNRFDQLTRVLAEGRTRRSTLKAIVGTVVGGLSGLLSATDVLGASCRKPAEVCRKNSDCCSNKCSAPDRTGRSRCLCETSANCPKPGSACKAATCTNGVCGEVSVCTNGQICNHGGCCTPEAPEVTCLSACGSVSNNCGQPVDCGPCCSVDGHTCTQSTECCSGSSCQSELCAPLKEFGEECTAFSDCMPELGCWTGQCLECEDDSNCDSDPNNCFFYLCFSGRCELNFVGDGFDADLQTVGDCKRVVCDGTGGTRTVDDGADVHDDNNQCTSNICTDGVASNPPVQAGAACTQNGGSVCDGNGNCVECVVPGDCGTDTACRTYSCDSNSCGFADVESGTFVSDEALGDCIQKECDGSGNIVDAANPDDVPLGGECNVNTCDGMSPSVDPFPLGTPCSIGKCDGLGQCVECVTTDDCQSPDICASNVCVGCLGDGQSCQDPSDCCSGYCSSICYTP